MLSESEKARADLVLDQMGQAAFEAYYGAAPLAWTEVAEKTRAEWRKVAEAASHKFLELCLR